MDRVISLLAALVGLIALAGAILVEVHGQSERGQLTASITELNRKVSEFGVKLETPDQEDGTVDALLALQDRIAALEKAAKAQVVPAAPTNTATGDAASVSAITADGPTTNCIPIGTRFMAKADEATAICRTDVVVRISEVTDGIAMIDGAGAVNAGAFGRLGFGGCTVMVFSADLISGYAELRVTCQ